MLSSWLGKPKSRILGEVILMKVFQDLYFIHAITFSPVTVITRKMNTTAFLTEVGHTCPHLTHETLIFLLSATPRKFKLAYFFFMTSSRLSGRLLSLSPIFPCILMVRLRTLLKELRTALDIFCGEQSWANFVVNSSGQGVLWKKIGEPPSSCPLPLSFTFVLVIYLPVDMLCGVEGM